MTTITTSTGTTIRLEQRRETDPQSLVVILDNPAAPDDMRDNEVGRVIDGGYQPAMFAPWALRPEVLRGIADLIDSVDVQARGRAREGAAS